MGPTAVKEHLEFMMSSPFGQRVGPDICEAMLASAETFEVPAGELAFEQGDPPRGLYMVVDGQCKLIRSGPGYREHIVHLAEPSAMFGEAALFLGGHPVSTVALKDTKLLLFPREPFLKTMQDHPVLQMYTMQVMATWISKLVEKIDELTLCDGAQRLARYLVGLHERSTFSEYVTGAHVDLPTRKRDLATMLNMNQPSLSRILRQLQDAELIDVQGRRVVLMDMEALKGMARIPTSQEPRRDFD